MTPPTNATKIEARFSPVTPACPNELNTHPPMTADDRADDADHKIADDPSLPLPRHDDLRQPARDNPHHDPRQNVHRALLPGSIPVTCRTQEYFQPDRSLNVHPSLALESLGMM